MSNVASLELCRELYELSGWRGDVRVYNFGAPGKHSISKFPHSTDPERWCPAYDLGYLLRKLPKFGKYTTGQGEIQNHKTRVTVTVADSGTWVATMDSTVEAHGWVDPQYADTPEDAAAKLCIELIKQEVLKP